MFDVFVSCKLTYKYVFSCVFSCEVYVQSIFRSKNIHKVLHQCAISYGILVQVWNPLLAHKSAIYKYTYMINLHGSNVTNNSNIITLQYKYKLSSARI